MYNVKIITSGDTVEIYKINNYVIKESKESEGSKIINKILEHKSKDSIKVYQEVNLEEKLNNRIKNLNKTRNNIIRCIKSNPDLKTFITLTFEKEGNYIDSKSKLNILFTKLRKKFSKLKYIWILEYGEKNNRLHYHILTNLPIGIKLSTSKEKKTEEHKQYEREFMRKYWPYGFVDIRHIEDNQEMNVALYVAVYMVKSMKDINLAGYRIWGRSHKTLNKPQEDKYYSIETAEEILKKYSGYKVKYSNSYSIGYTDYRREHRGLVSYYELVKENKYENK